MKRAILLLVSGVVFFFAAQSYVLALDPPHNLDNEVDCNDCHGEALFSNPNMTAEEKDAAMTDVCKLCHQFTHGSYRSSFAPAAETHGTDAMTNPRCQDSNPDCPSFATNCTDCHHPHFQTDQFLYGRLQYPSDFFLATGTASSGNITNDSVPGYPVTRIVYTTLTVKAGSEWDTSGPPENDPDVGINKFGEKTDTGRGAILLRSVRSHNYGHIIDSIDAATNTIVVKGTFSEVSSSGFGIAYGQLVLREIQYSSASGESVRFFDREDENSYAYNEGVSGGTDPTPNGVCQVCHTRTTHWRQTGEESWDIGTDTQKIEPHYSGTNCTRCHLHAGGFKPTFEDHYDTSTPFVTDYTNDPLYPGSFSPESDETCIGCHISPPPNNTYGIDRDYIFNVHNSECTNCHITYERPLQMRDGSHGGANGQPLWLVRQAPFTTLTLMMPMMLKTMTG
jgi:hypothetical protein